MNWFRNLKIGSKLISGFVLVTLVAAVVGIVAMRNLRTIQAADSALYQNQTVGVAQLGYVSSAFHRNRLNLVNLTLARTAEERNRYAARVRELVDQMTNAAAEYAKTLQTDSDRSFQEKYLNAYNGYVPLRDKVVELALAGRSQEAEVIMHGDGQKAADELKTLIDEMVSAKITAARESAEANERLAATSQIVMLTTLGVGVILAIAIGLLISRAIARPVSFLAEKAAIMATGDLTVEVHQHSTDEVGQLAGAFQTMIRSLRETIGHVEESSAAVASAANEISSSAEQMAAGSQEQTSQAHEVASAVEEMTKTIVENSRNAGDTAETAKQARQTAETGGRVVEETVTGMKRIAAVVNKSAETVRTLGKSSDQIGEIIGVIDDIADQTNLLALNAAIEAARAGDQGRGFAVVADEVRKLAERTTKATKEIATMIKQIQAETSGAVTSMEEGTQQVEEGIKLADKAGESLHEIVESIGRVTDMIGQIAAANEEQSSASEQISKNVEAISSVTGETAQATQQIARAAEDLSRLTENQQRLVARFKISGETSAKGRAHVKTEMRPHGGNGASSSGAVLHEDGSPGSEVEIFDIDSAKSAHLSWKVRIQKMLAGKEQLDENSIASHRDCKLGKWYYGVGGAKYRGSEAFAELGQRHEEMHKAVKRTAALYNAGQKGEARSSADDVYRLASDVIRLLDSLEQEASVLQA